MEVNTPIAEDIRITDQNSQYDDACKKLLSEKIILAWIMKCCLEEFRDSEYQDASCMEALLEPGDFLLWKQYFQADRSCCHKSC